MNLKAPVFVFGNCSFSKLTLGRTSQLTDSVYWVSEEKGKKETGFLFESDTKTEYILPIQVELDDIDIFPENSIIVFGKWNANWDKREFLNKVPKSATVAAPENVLPKEVRSEVSFRLINIEWSGENFKEENTGPYAKFSTDKEGFFNLRHDKIWSRRSKKIERLLKALGYRISSNETFVGKSVNFFF